MNKGLHLVSFAVGAVLGSAASWFVLKKKYERIAQEEIDSVKEAFHNKMVEVYATQDNTTEEITENEDETLKEAYDEILQHTGYAGEVVNKKPVCTEIISPVDLGEYEHYKVVGLVYYADEVLATEDGQIVDVNDTIGEYALTQFGEYDENAVHVRNTALETDFEVLLDERDYSEVYK